ncbi:MAG: radical SAM protein [Bacilli bacterium]|jgi:DNA repair photolyase|nr:radical SAM protein [Bacilli bacterium]
MDQTTRKSLLYKTDVEYGDYTVNHVTGCSHGCLFPCYAFNMAKRFGHVKTYADWIKPKLVSNSIELLDKELPKLKGKIKSVQLCFTTDPFMDDYPEVGEMTLKIINRINQDNIMCRILTKGTLPEYLQTTKKINEYGITLVSLDDSFKKQYEPLSTSYKERVNALKALHDKGYKTWVSIEPFPTPNMGKTAIEDILKKINFVDYIVFGRLHYNKIVGKYKDYQEFYNSCAKKVISFCMTNKIKCHIKTGTYIVEGKDSGGDFF